MNLTTSEGGFEVRKKYQRTYSLADVRRRVEMATVANPVGLYSCGDSNRQIWDVMYRNGHPSAAMLKAIGLEECAGGFRKPLSDYEEFPEMLKRVRKPSTSSKRFSAEPILVQFS